MAKENADTTVTVNFLKQIVPEWNKVSTYFVIIVMAWAGFTIVSGFETPKEKEVHKRIESALSYQKHEDSLKIEALNTRLNRWDKKMVIDSFNDWKRDDLQLKIGVKLGIDVTIYEAKK